MSVRARGPGYSRAEGLPHDERFEAEAPWSTCTVQLEVATVTPS
jgi:hypothetical protein